MRVIVSITVVWLCLLLLDCSQLGKSDDRYTYRIGGCAESINDTLYVFGGMNLLMNLPAVGSYDLSANKWKPRSNIPTARALAESVVVGDSVYIIGGRNNNSVLSTMQLYSSIEDKWLPCASIPTARWSLMASHVDGEIYVFGGLSGIGNNRRALDIIESYNLTSCSWRFVGRMPGARQGAAIAGANELIYIISGKTASYAEPDSTSPITEHVDSFDPSTRIWKRLQDIPTGRMGAKAVVANGLIFVVGGLSANGDLPTQIDVFDPSLEQWIEGPSLSKGRAGPMCALVGNSIVVMGGSSKTDRASINGTVEIISLSGYKTR